MSTLLFLTACKMKNKFTELLKKPLKLIITLGLVALLVMNFSLSQGAPVGNRPLVEFEAIIFVFYLFCFVTEIKKGFQSGGTMFSMADVNLLFLSPVNPVSVLFHGMLSRLGSSMWMALAFVYQFALLRSYYPVTAPVMLTAVAGYGAVVFLSQLAGMLVYFFTCGQQKRIKKAKAVLYSLCGVFAGFFAATLIASGDFTATSLAASATALPMRFFPVAGWIFTTVEGLMLAETLKVLISIMACVVFVAAAFVFLAFSKRGYYEDVLLSAEKSADKKADAQVISPDKISMNVKGMKRGEGASAFLYKHMLENRRIKKVFLSPTSLFYLILIAVYGFVFKSDFTVLFSLSCTVSFLPVLSGRWIKELTLPYIYLVPESAVRKLFYILPEMLPKIITEGVLQCVFIGVICRLGAVTVILLIIARLSFSMVLVCSALITARIFRESEKNNVFAAVCLVLGIVFSIPSVVLCIVFMNIGAGIVFSFALMSLSNVFISAILLFFARNLLKSAQ